MNDQPTHSKPACGYFRAGRSEDGLELIKANSNAFILLYIIAHRARWSSGINRFNLQPGEALIGDYENYGMSEKEYRTAKAALERFKLAAFKGANRGTIATLTNSTVFDINLIAKDEQAGFQGATEGRTEGGQGAANKERKERKKERKTSDIAALAADSPRKVFIDSWTGAYKDAFGAAYLFQDAKDGSAVKRLLGKTGQTPQELITLARRAWSKAEQFNCGQAVTIAGFASRFNQISAELRQSQSRQPFPGTESQATEENRPKLADEERQALAAQLRLNFQKGLSDE